MGRQGDERRTGRRLLGVALATVALLVPTTAPLEPASAAPTTPHQGTWSAVGAWPLIAIHAVLTGDGRVLTYGTTAAGKQTGLFTYDVWTPNASPALGHSTLPNTTTTDLFCNIQIVDPATERVVMFGGDVWNGTSTTNRGTPGIVTYDPVTSTLEDQPAMQRPRWYATAVTLLDGRILVMGGKDGNDRAEVWHAGTTELLPFSTSHLDYWYPRLFALPDGSVFGFDTRAALMFRIDPTLQTLTNLGVADPALANRFGSAVQISPWSILAIGGTTAKTFVIDLSTGAPVVTPSGGMSSVRAWVNGTLLPDGRVLATGGSAVDNTLTGVNNSAEIWDPATGEWTLDAAGTRARLYHSTALLLPDGRVLVAGGGAPGPQNNTNAEIYTPPYLLDADGDSASRPTVSLLGPRRLVAGDDLVLHVRAAGVQRVTLLKSGSVTHSFNFDQRFAELPFSTNGRIVTATLPTGNVLTPGNYLVHVIDSDGVPSVAEIITVTTTSRPLLDGIGRVAQPGEKSISTSTSGLAPALRLNPPAPTPAPVPAGTK